ncbi:MAG TPA: non-heme iron oxygenase ferredoxin subunit [Steroidobacteraceae bacterium]|jgi:3-phenylpropionate/trans-cinnamate dioxygenase ferredoxin subunit|nr:non-heme iron oxygenase ferredoxin subunit [Steroidobacteraceae bacterium]
MSWVDAGSAADLGEGQTISIAVGRRMIALVMSGGELFAVDDVCTHDGAELTGGAVEGAEIICPRHGARFCLRTGEALTPPAYEPIRVYPTKIEDGRLWVRAD